LRLFLPLLSPSRHPETTPCWAKSSHYLQGSVLALQELGLTPEQRFANHKAGTKAASLVKRYGSRLLPDLYAHLNPMPFEAAA
jgi:hypothetical protein